MRKKPACACRSLSGLQTSDPCTGDETRQLILLTLLESDHTGLRVGEITARTHLSRPAVSHHLKILRDAGIITLRRRGTMNFYYMAADAAEWEKLHQLTGQICSMIQMAKTSGYLPPEDE